MTTPTSTVPPTPPPADVTIRATTITTTTMPAASSEAVTALFTQLGLRHAAAIWPAWLERATRHDLPYPDLLQGVLEEELAGQTSAATQRRLRQAGFPFSASIEQFDFRFRPELKRQLVLRYLDPTFVAQGQSLALIGAPGLGKTMLAVAIATKHVQLGATARFITAQRLASQLGRTATAAGRQRLLQPLLRCDVLVLDEFGYLPTEPAFGPAVYELIAGRYETRATIITSNKSLPAWSTVLQDASLASAVIDRLLHHGDVFYLQGPSWRLKGKTPPEGSSGSEGTASP